MSIYGQNSDFMMNACVNSSFDPSGAYIDGFLHLAEIGIDRVNRRRSHQDTLIYPIAYLLRHHLELLMKEVILQGRELLDRTNRPRFGHNLIGLWSECSSIIGEVWPDGSQEVLLSAEKILGELSELDPSGEAFRYARSRDGSLSLRTTRRTINLLSLHFAVKEVSDLLSGVNAALSEYLSFKREMERAMF